MRGALRWSAAEEAAVRISAVRSQVERTANECAASSGDSAATEQMQKQLRHGMSELDSIRQFLHEGINSGNKQFVESGSKDAVLHHALEKGLVELETVRKRLVNVLRSTSSSSGEASAPAATTPTNVRRPQSASVKRDAKADPRKPFARPGFGVRINGSQSDVPSNGINLNGWGPQTTKPAQQPRRASSTTKQRPQSATAASLRRAQQQQQQQQQRPEDDAKPVPKAGWTDSTMEAKATPPTPAQQPKPAMPSATKKMMRPSSAPNRGVRQQSVNDETDGDKQTGSNPGQSASAWGKYQDWAQNVLNRVQSRRVQQHRQGINGLNGVNQDKQESAEEKVSSSQSSAAGVQPRTTAVRPSSAKVPSAGPAASMLRRMNSAGVSRPSTNQQQQPSAPKLDNQAQALREQGNVLFQQKRYSDSAECYSKALAIEPNSETLYCNRAAAYLMNCKFEEALNDSLKAVDLDPTHVKAHWRAAKAYLYLGNSEQAKHWYGLASKLADSPNDNDAIAVELRTVDIVEKCRRCLRLREWNEASRCADNILEVFPPSGPCSAPWQCLKAEAVINIDPQEANQTLTRICQEDPNNAEAWYLRAKALFYTGHDAVSTNSACGYIQKARDADPKHSRAASLLTVIESFAKLRDEGNSAYAAGRWQEAYLAYTKCLTVDAYNSSLKAIILCNRAAVCIQCERWKDAMDDINQSIGYNPQNAKAYARRARLHQHLGNHDAAVKDLQLAVQMYPSAENQERLTQAIELKNSAAKQRQSQGQDNSKFRYFNFANGQQSAGASRPSTAGARRPQAGTSRPSSATTDSRARRHSHYETLGVERRCDERAITKAYREGALKWHPDKWATGTEEQKAFAENMFKEVSTAYGVLRDAARRRQYDLTL